MSSSSSLDQTLRELSRITEALETLTHQIGTETLTSEPSGTWVILLMIFVLSCFIGYFVVWNVTPALHAPLMSVTNAVSSVIIVGGILAVAADPPWMWIGLLAIFIASVNIVGGFLVSHRMLSMFKTKKKSPPSPSAS
jgi:NAD(P) transhydrogenase subunit alpha